MMKAVLMAGAAMISAPVLAQEAPASPTTEFNTQVPTTSSEPAADRADRKARKAEAAADKAETAAAEAETAAADANASATTAEADAAAAAPAAEPAQPAEQAAATDTPAMTDPATAPAQSAATTAPAQPATTAPAQQPAQSAATTTAPANAGDQVAQIVNAEFPTYDKDAKGSLTKEEFGTWMVALRSASDPSVNAQSAEMQTWIGQAFTSADTDKNSQVSKEELTSFLSQGKS